MKDLLRDNGHVMLMRLFGHCKWACTCGRTSTTRRVSLRATSQPSGLTEQARVTRVRVERQTHLPASREEAWAALKQLVPREEWEELSAVFVALETIHRCIQRPPCSLTLRPGCLDLVHLGRHIHECNGVIATDGGPVLKSLLLVVQGRAAGGRRRGTALLAPGQ